MLKKLLDNGQIFEKSYIFAGPSGTGKTTTARILARAMLCDNVTDDAEPCNDCATCRDILEKGESHAFKEMDAANHSGKDDIQNMLEDMKYYTIGGSDRRIYLIDECFTADTLILTENGLQTIESIVEDEYDGLVSSYDTEEDEQVWRPVTDWFEVGTRETIKLEFEGGVELTVTLDQDIYTHNRGWVQAKNLTQNDVPCFVDATTSKSFIQSVRKGRQKVYDVSVKDTHCFFARSCQGGPGGMVLAHNCHRLSKAAMDALLKPMEDNVPGTQDKRLVCLFCTTEPEKLRTTIKTRCMMFPIREPDPPDVRDRLAYICEQEGFDYTDEAMDLIFQEGDGHIRNMINMVEKTGRLGSINTDSVREQLGLSARSKYYDIIYHLGHDLDHVLDLLDSTLDMTTPRAVYDGLGEACMSSYRYSKGIETGIMTSNQTKAEKVYERHSDDLLNVMEYILDSDRKLTSDVLHCEIFNLHRMLSGDRPFTSDQIVVRKEPSGDDQSETEHDPPDDESEDESENQTTDENDSSLSESASMISPTFGGQFVNSDRSSSESSDDPSDHEQDRPSPEPPEEEELKTILEDL